jgi:hypothetical protein
MSIRVMTAVWDHADVSGGDLLVLLAMADCADDDGRKCFPTQGTLAAKSRMTDRNLRYCLLKLQSAGYISQVSRRQGGVVEWRVNPDPENIAARNSASGGVGSGLPTDPSGIHQEKDVSNETSSSSALAEPSRPTSKTADSNGKRMVPPPDRAERLRQAGGVLKLCYRLAELMVENDPKAKPKPSSVGWMDAAEKLMRIDERHFEECMAVLEWSQRDEFWKGNVLSMPKFREKYPTLRAQWVRSRQQQSAAAAPVSSAELAAAFERGPSRSGL